MRLLGPLAATSRVAETIDERLMRCGVSRRAFLQFCSSLMVAAPFGLAITDKKTPEEVAAGLGKVIRPPVIWLAFSGLHRLHRDAAADFAPGRGRSDSERHLARIPRDVDGGFG